MKIGVISDVHSNIDALKRAFEEFEKEKIDKIISVGDVIGIGPYPRECMDFYMENQDKFLVMIRGNHEGYLLNGIPERNHNRKNGRPLTIEEKSMHSWNHKLLRDDQVEFIKKWEKRAEIEVEGIRIVVEHYPMNDKGKFKKFYKIPTEEQISKILEGENTDIYIFGHTHEDIYYNYENKIYINPGSLGCPIKTGGANIGVLEINNKKVKYKQLAPKYDVNKVIDDINNLAYPIHKLMIRIFYNKKI